jgi:hypothetical protein
VWLEENTLSIVILCTLSFFLGVPAALIVGGLRFLSIHQLAVAACRYQCCIVLFQAFLVQVTALKPHTMGRLLAVSPDMAELLAIVSA